MFSQGVIFSQGIIFSQVGGSVLDADSEPQGTILKMEYTVILLVMDVLLKDDEKAKYFPAPTQLLTEVQTDLGNSLGEVTKN